MILQTPVLEIKNLKATINDIEVIKDLTLTVNKGEIHAIMGPNGSGKSTFSKIVAGHPAYNVRSGDIFFKGKSILQLEPDERAHLGIFLAFQYPVEIPGVSNYEFLEYACKSKLEANNIDTAEYFFYEEVTKKTNAANIPEDLLYRNVNEGFSGGEKKRNEILQLIVLDPDLAILDEADSGLDIDGLKDVSKNINEFMNEEKSLILITHYQRLLEHIKPDYVHVMYDGKIVKTGNAQLAQELELKGYQWLKP